MNFLVKSINAEKQKSDCLVVGVHSTKSLSSAAKALDEISEGELSKILALGDIQGEIGQTLLLQGLKNVPASRILLVGCGKAKSLSQKEYGQLIKSAYDVLKSTHVKDVAVFLTDLAVDSRSIYWKARRAAEIIGDLSYQFEQFKQNPKAKPKLTKWIFNVVDKKELPSAQNGLDHGVAIAKGVKDAKDLANMPPNICNPLYLAEQAKSLAQDYKDSISLKLIDEKEMKKLGMESYLAVGRGSKNESVMSILEYKGSANKNDKPVVLVGKGLTFDTGGISLKPAPEMDEMKYDMCGAASVFGVMRAIAELKLPINVIGVLAGCENMPGSNAYRPGDILKTLSGQTVEVLNTDAEGRLVLCDALTYVERFKPEVVIDIATLTGACVIALGGHISGLMSPDDTVANDLLKASNAANDKFWRLPMDEEYNKQLESNFADMANIGGRAGGTITAACFLGRFTKNYPWAHLDIAGTSYVSGKAKGATGRPVTALVEYLLQKAKVSEI
ncbi:leucyl aminopeptidase [Thorsellia kenyensis]|uniref:Probable cytosol aminopeptidase n=1 Tax=Thorsellia kenyensis TaxID=1549888 RepID=A0ABV6CBZ1_9GAMM